MDNPEWPTNGEEPLLSVLKKFHMFDPPPSDSGVKTLYIIMKLVIVENVIIFRESFQLVWITTKDHWIFF